MPVSGSQFKASARKSGKMNRNADRHTVPSASPVAGTAELLKAEFFDCENINIWLLNLQLLVTYWLWRNVPVYKHKQDYTKWDASESEILLYIYGDGHQERRIKIL